MNRTLSALAVAGFCCTLGLPAAAQLLTPSYYGRETAGELAAMRTEADCLHGIPLDPDSAKASMDRVQKAFAAYIALTPNAAPKDLFAVFTVDDPGTPFQDGDQKAKLGELASHLAPPALPPKLITVVMGGDNQTTRTIWSGQDAGGPVFYGVDFSNGTSMSRAHILDIAISHGTPPETPPAYCHMNGRFVRN